MDWGVPDWTDDAAYPGKRSLLEWWWQFTRRRPDYRRLWEKWAPINEEHVMASRDELERLAQQQGDTIDLFLDRAPTDDPDRIRIEYQMSVLLNPRKDFPDWILAQHRYRRAGVIDHGSMSLAYQNSNDLLTRNDDLGEVAFESMKRRTEHRESLEKEAGLVRYVFDLSRPLNPQLAHASNFLGSVQSELYGTRNTPKPNTQNWKSYLRILDAVDAGARHRQIGEVLWPKTNRRWEGLVRDNLNSALKVRDNFPI